MPFSRTINRASHNKRKKIMEKKQKSFWYGFALSVQGSGHVKRGLPCQDASAVRYHFRKGEAIQEYGFGRPALIVCDGRGSAPRSQEGANRAVRAFMTESTVLAPILASILDLEPPNGGTISEELLLPSEDHREDSGASSPRDDDMSRALKRWKEVCKLFYRELWQVQINLAVESLVNGKDARPSDFDFTVAAAIVGTRWIGCFQVGDGAIVLQQDGCPVTALLQHKGEWANETVFLRENGESNDGFHFALYPAQSNTGIAITSDGPEMLMFKTQTMEPGPIFPEFFRRLQEGDLIRQDLHDYLTREKWEEVSHDDKSIAILAPLSAEAMEKLSSKQDLTSAQTAPTIPHDAEAPTSTSGAGLPALAGKQTKTTDVPADPKTGKAESGASSEDPEKARQHGTATMPRSGNGIDSHATTPSTRGDALRNGEVQDKNSPRKAGQSSREVSGMKTPSASKGNSTNSITKKIKDFFS